MDLWNPKTFDDALCEKLTDHSELITAYHQEAQFLTDKRLGSMLFHSTAPKFPILHFVDRASQQYNLVLFSMLG